MIVKKLLKDNKVVVKITTPDDLWVLKNVILPGDIVRGSTERKIVIGDSREGKAKSVRKRVTLSVKVEKVSFEDEGVRVLGTIIDGPDFVPRGEHHSFHLSVGDEIIIKKDYWQKYQLKRLDEGARNEKPLLILFFDREEARFLEANNRGVIELLRLKGDVVKKDLDSGSSNKLKGSFYDELVAKLLDFDSRKEYSGIVIGSPAFWKDYLSKVIDKNNSPEADSLRKKIVFTTISDIDKTAVKELLRRPEVKSLLKQNRAFKEEEVVAQVLKALSLDKLAYGFADVKSAIDEGNISEVVVTENLISKCREEGDDSIGSLETLLRSAEEVGAEVTILESESREVDGLTGIVGIKRW